MIEDLRLWLPIAIAIAVFAWNIRLHFSGVRKDEIAKVQKEMIDRTAALSKRIEECVEKQEADADAGVASRQAVAERLTKMEAEIQNLPSKDSVHNLAIEVTAIRGSINTQGETLKAVQATASRVEEFLINRGKS